MKIKMYVFKMFILLLVCFLFEHSALGWGSGHDYVNRDALTVMPKAIKTFLGKKNLKKFVHWSHAPDTQKLLKDEQSKYPITDKEIAYINSFGGKKLYSLHSSRKPGQGGNFILLIRAFMDKDPARSAFWMSTIMHTIADDVACNHTSQIHYLTYGLKVYNIKMGNGIGFDYAHIAKTPEGKKAINSLLKNYRPQIIQGTPDEVLEKILSSKARAATYSTIREYNIVATYAPKTTIKTRVAGIKAMAELGAYGVEKGLNIIVTAWNFAKAGQVPTLTSALIAKVKQQNQKEYLATRDLADDSIYTGLLKNAKKGAPSIGILLERSQPMMRSHLSFGGRLVMAATMRTLNVNKIPYCTIDLRDLNMPNSKILDIKKIPLLILCSGSFHVSNNVKKNLKKYFMAGGRILLVGGRDKGLLGDLSKSLTKADPAMLPVTKKYGRNNTEVIDKINIKFLPPFNKVLGDKKYRFINNPDTIGSHPPWCLLKIKPVNKYVKPLVELSVDDKVICIVAELTDKKGKPKAIFMPEYLLAPFLLDDTGDELVNVVDITLDRVGAKILLQAIKLLK